MHSQYSILIVEDDTVSCQMLKTVFETQGYEVYISVTGRSAALTINEKSPDIILLDLGLPDIDGLKLLGKIRKFYDMPVIVLSARSSEDDKVSALELGADDYITKPFGALELIARINNAIRHSPRLANKNEEIFRYEDMTINYRSKKVTVNNREVHLTGNEYSIISLLSKNAGKILTYENIIKKIWGPNPGGDTRILRVNMANIRKKIEQDTSNPVYIITETGIGYRMPC